MDFIKAVLFDFSLAISIGPIAILIMNQSIHCGLKNGLKSGLGAALADLSYALLAFAGEQTIISLLNDYHELFRIVSSGLLLLFALRMTYTSVKKMVLDNANSTSVAGLSCNKPLFTIYSLTLLNPLTILVFSGLAGQFPTLAVVDIMMLSAGIFAGSLVVQWILALAGKIMADFFIGKKWIAYLNLVSALAIAGFGLSGFWQ